jgi:type I site-specific restriction endonuclease
MQGHSITVLTAEDKVASIKLKLKSWYHRVQQNKFDCFDTMNEYLEEPGKAVPESVKHDVTEYLRQLQNSFEEYFPPNNNDNNWLRNPFIPDRGLLNQGI